MTLFLLGLLLHFSPLSQAEEAYHAGRYREAVRLYGSALQEQDADQGSILFNLGNCAYRLGRHAEAVLFYKRAQLRLPRDPEVAFNLLLAKEHLGINGPDERSFSAYLLALVQWWTPSELLALTVGLQLIGLSGWVLLRRKRSFSNAMIFLVLFALAGEAWLVKTQWFASSPEGVVLAREIALHSEPHTDLSLPVKLKAGETLKILEQSDRWSRIEHRKGSGWVERKDIGMVD